MESAGHSLGVGRPIVALRATVWRQTVKLTARLTG